MSSYQYRPILNTIPSFEIIEYALEYYYDELKERIEAQEVEALKN